jgi:N-acetylglucosaminyldiphosphoundecaprenol N-acetyl-beta-D-mannosaminyltransferase
MEQTLTLPDGTSSFEEVEDLAPDETARRSVQTISTSPLSTVDLTSPTRIRLLGMPLSVVTEDQAVAHIVQSARSGRGGWVITPNLDQLRLFRRDPHLRPMYEAASLVVADGMPLVWASRIQRTPLPERVAGSSMILTLSAAAAKAGLTVFFLGGNPGAAELAAEELVRRQPELNVAGCHCPPFGFDKDPAELARIRQMLAQARPDIVYVGLGFPKQERLIEKLRPSLFNAWFLGIGISFSFVAGQVKRAPRFMQRLGLEWLHRLAQEPGRLLRRYLVHGIPFAIMLLAKTIVVRMRTSSRK